MTFSDLIKEIIDSSKERVKNPISGAYILSFLLWNWRPIALLLFEKTTITAKILVINSEYCNIMAVVGPFLLGIFFTVGIPHIMTFIDLLLMSANKKRLETIYKIKDNELQEQIKLVALELELQDKKNRSKTTADFEQEITTLKNKFDILDESNKSIIADYEQKLKDLNSILQKNSVEKGQPINNDISKTLLALLFNNNLHPRDFKFLEAASVDKTFSFDAKAFEPKILKFLLNQKFLEKQGHYYKMTYNGRLFLKFVGGVLD